MRALILPLLLTACGHQPTKPDLPPPDGQPVHTVTVEVRYVPIDAALTADCEIEPAGALSEAPLVAAKRKAALESCTARMRAIRQIQGTPIR